MSFRDVYDSEQQQLLLQKPEKRSQEIQVDSGVERELLDEKTEDIKHLVSELTDLRETFAEMSVILSQDTEKIDRIEDLTEKIETQTEAGTEELRKASNFSHKVTIPLTCAAVGALFGPVGMYLGLKGGTLIAAISGGGALVGALFGREINNSSKV